MILKCSEKLMFFVLHQIIMQELQKKEVLPFLIAMLPPHYMPELAQYLCSCSGNGIKVGRGKGVDLLLIRLPAAA